MRILVIDDEPRILGFLARGLAAEGYSVDVADNGAEAMRAARRQRYDLVLLDLLLPGIDGLSVLQGAWAPGPRAADRDRVRPLRSTDEAARIRPRRG